MIRGIMKSFMSKEAVFFHKQWSEMKTTALPWNKIFKHSMSSRF